MLVSKMKFLILQRIRPSTSVKTLAQLTPAQFKYIEELQRLGKVETYYHLVGQQGHMIIVDASSDDELSKIVSDDPLFFYSRRKIYPLTTLEVHKKHLKEIIKELS